MIFHIAMKELLVTLRDRKALMILLLMPIVIMLILGSAFSSMFSSGGGLGITRYSIAVVDYDNDTMSKVFIDDFIIGEMAEIFDPIIVSEEEATEMLKDEKVPSIIIIPKNFTEDILEGNPVNIEVRSHVNWPFRSDIVNGVMEDFTQYYSTSFAGARAALDTSIEYNLPVIVGENNNFELQEVLDHLKNDLKTNRIVFNRRDEERNRTLTSMQYYSATMLVMFILFGALRGARVLIEERETKTLGRIITARGNVATLITGKFLGFLITCLAQALILIMVARIFYGVDWGSSLVGFVYIILSTVFAGSAFAMFFAAIAKTSESADSIGNSVIQVFTVLGGGMVPIYFFPSFVQSIARITPNWWATQGIHSIMLGENLASIIPYGGALILMGVVYLSIGIKMFKVE